MQKKKSSQFQRILSLFLCAAMVCSYIVLPVGAEAAADPVPVEKFLLNIDNINGYESNEAVITHGNWLSYQADNGNTSLKNFLINEADQYVDLLPADGKTYWSDSVRETCAKAFFNEDGTVSIVNYYSVTGFNWPYVYTQPEVAIDLQMTRWLYFTYESTNYFNVVLDYTYNGTAYSVKPQTVDYPVAGSAMTYCVDLHAVTGLSSGTIVLEQCKFYTVGDYEGYVKLHNFGLASSEAAARTYASGGTGTYMDGYTVLMIEYMGSRQDGLSGAEGVEFFVDAVIDCGLNFDEEPHQLKSKTDYGFMLYIPDAVMDNLAQKPARGDLVDASFLAYGLRDYSGGTTAAGHTLTFYENPTNTLKHATAADVNATVKLFNYDETVSRDGFNFWDGYWGWGGNAESVDGEGVEDGKYRNPVPLNTLSDAGYPQLDDGAGGAYALDYLFDGTQIGADGGSALVSSMKNGGGLFQMDEDGYYYYDSMQNAAYYDEAADRFVLMEDLIVRPWYNSNSGGDYKNGSIYTDYADVSGTATAYGNFLPFNEITQNNVTVDGGVYYNAQQTGRQDEEGNWIYTDIHTADEAYAAYRKAVGSLERYGLTNTAADKVLAGNKAMFRDAYDRILEANGGDVMSARLEDQLDLGFGMTVDFDFYQPQGGKFNGEDMEFDFLGDDDVFVYVGIWTGTEYEYRLVLDIGGIHEAKNGNINFATGTVADWPSSSSSARTGRSLYQIFLDTDGDGVVSESEAAGEMAQYFDGEVFGDFTKLSLKFFYLERGGNISYCRLRFNMPTLPENSLTISKALDADVLGSQSYQFRVLKAELNSETGLYEATDELFIPEGTRYTLAGTNQTGTVGVGGYFTLTPGQGVTFDDVLSVSDGATHYVVEETITQEVDSQFTVESPECSVNGVSRGVTEMTNAGEGIFVYRSEVLELEIDEKSQLTKSQKTQLVGFTNLVNEEKLGKLRITKKIREGSDLDPNAFFDMRVTIGGKLLSEGTTYDIVDAATGEIIQEDVEVTRKGYVTIKDGQAAVIDRILSTSAFDVTEITYDSTPTYSCQNSDVICTGSGASGVMPLGGDITILVVNSDSSGLTVDKTVSAGEQSDEFHLTLEAFSTGMTSSLASTNPADIVLVLDQSASMYTPKGADAYRYDRWVSQNSNTNLTKLSTDQLDTVKGSHLGYYVAQSKEANRYLNEAGNYDYNGDGDKNDTSVAIYDWFIVQYVYGTGWVYVRVGDTTTSVAVDTAAKAAYDSSSGSQYNLTLVSNEGSGKLITSFNYYQSQYGALYESVNEFVSDLAASSTETGVEHRIAITGFSSPYYDGIQYYDGTGLYIDGTYYLYDTDYKYMGYANSAATHGYTLYAPDEIYNSMASILPAALEGNVWSSTVPDGVTLVPLDPNQANSAGTTITAGGKTYTKGQYFAPVPAADSLLGHNVITDEEYQNALMTVHTVDAEGNVSVSAGVSASVEAIRTNFQQTCPAAGLEMAGKILEKNRTADRDQIVILFTDGVPTVSLGADREYGISSNAGVRETYWSGMSGARDAVNLANDLKGLGIQIYTIGTSGLTGTVPVDPNNNDDGASVTSITGNRFLDYVSSNYQGVSCVHTVHTKGYDTADTGDDDNQILAVSALNFWQTVGDTVIGITDANPAVQSSDIYTKTAADGDFSVAFGEIMKTVSSPNVTLGKEAVLQDTLSEYFDLNTMDPTEIEVCVAPYTGTDADGVHTFGTPVPASEVGFNIGVAFGDDGSHSNAVINVSGFSYSEHYVRQDPETKEMLGYKLIVKVPIKARAGFWGGNNVPTNKYSAAIYDGSGNEVQPFPMPEANVPVVPAVAAGDKTVYYGGNVNSNELLSNITVGGQNVNVGTDGSLTPAQDWMDDYAVLTWTAGSTVPGYTTVDNKNADIYPYSVTLSPIHDGSENLSQNPSNIAGAVVANRTASDDANVYVLVPVITWRDVTIDLGDAVGSAFFKENDFVSLEWVDQDTQGVPVLPPVDTAPELSYLYSASGKPIQDTPVDVHVISSYGDEDITNYVIYRWENCTNSSHMTNRDQIFEHSGSEVSREFYIHVNGEDALVSDKTISTISGTDLFELTLEGYVTGAISELHITKPADIVLVLDHSGSMHTPVGATEVLHSPSMDPDNPNVVIDPGEVYTGDGQLTKAQLSTEKGVHRGYYVAQSTSSKWWFLMEYDAASSLWIGYSIPSTEAIVNPEGWTEHTMTQRWSYDNLPAQLVFYKTQYGALYDSVISFVEDLRESGVEHAVSIVGFAGAQTEGTRIYVGGDEDVVKTYKALYHENTTAARRMELFRKAMKNVQDDAQYAELLGNINEIETNSSFTCPSAGIKLANELYNANHLDRGERDRIMILFTDGIPNRGMNDGDTTTMTQAQIYDEIVTEAATAKLTYGSTVYSVSTTTLGTDTARDFLRYASSDYPNATGFATPGAPIETPRYTMQVNGIDSMNIVFDTVTQQVSGTDIKLDGTTILRDTLSDYFRLAGTAADITVYTSDYDGNGGWREPTAFPDAVIETSATDGSRIDTIEITGFDYSAAYISEEARLKEIISEDGGITTVAYYGSKLVVKVKVKARDGFWGGNNVPTNESNAGIFGDGGEELDLFPLPEANVPVKPIITAKDQVIYYGEDDLDALQDLVDTITVGGKPVAYDKETGKFVPGNTTDAEDDWMDDFADMSWNPELLNPADPDTLVSGTEPGDYTFGVILLPKAEQTGEENSTVEGDNYIAGDPIDAAGTSSDPATGSVDILVPVLTFKDSFIDLGDTIGESDYESINRQPTIQWVNKEDPYGTAGMPTVPSEGFNTEPSLKLTYSPDTDEEGCFTQDTPVNVEVYLGTEINITDEVYFDWIHCGSDLHNQNETIADDVTGDSTHRHSGTTDSNEFYIHVTYPLNEDTVVIDFGLSVDIAVLENDDLPEGTLISSIAKADTVPTPFSKTEDTANTYGTTAGGSFGDLVKNTDGSTLCYTLSSMTMNDKDVFVYMVQFPGDSLTGYCYSTVTVIPATSIYFEDNFVEYSVSTSNGDGTYTTTDGGWNEIFAQNESQAEDRPGNALDSLDANNIYGYDGAYTDMTTYSGGTAKWVTVNDGKYADATFTFWGTGFDIVSLTDANSGTILVMVEDLENDVAAKNYLVDTYYGYKYVPGEDGEKGKWVVDSNDSDTLYQVPVMKVDMGTYSHYKVTINVSWAFWLDHGQNDGSGSYNFYLDAIRIYNPADDGVKTDENGEVTDTTIRDVYEADGEANPVYRELRNMLIHADTFDQLGSDEIVAGAIFIDGNTALSDGEGGSYGSIQEESKTFAVSEYINYGPNNELYLAPNQGVTFTLDSVGASDRVHIAMKSVGDFGGQNDGIGDNDGSVSLEIFGVDANGREVYLNGESREIRSVSTATDLYYDITELAGTTVVIRNVGSAGIASITNLKTTNNPEPVMLTISRRTVSLALTALNEGDAVPVKPVEGEISLKYATATFEDRVKLNVYFDTQVDAQEMGLITFSSEVTDGTLDNAEKRIPGARAYGGGSYSVSTEGIIAKHLGDMIWMRVYARLADGSVVYSKLVSYSPKTYAMSILAGDYSAPMKALAVAMLNYGAAAQCYFGHDTDSLANADLTAQQQALVQPYNGDMITPVTQPDASKTGSFTANGGFAQKYPTVSFEDAFAINYYFTPDRTPVGDMKLYYWSSDDYEAAGVLSVDNATGILTVTNGMARVSGIAAKDMDSTVYVAAVYEAEGVRYCTGVLAYSIGAYFAAQASAGNALAEAAAVYGFYARNYFGA